MKERPDLSVKELSGIIGALLGGLAMYTSTDNLWLAIEGIRESHDDLTGFWAAMKANSPVGREADDDERCATDRRPSSRS